MSTHKQIILVTGGNSGIGFSLVSLLIQDSSKHVLFTSRSIEKGRAAIERLLEMKQPGAVEMLQLDLSEPQSIARLVSDVSERYGRLDALVNNAGQAIAPPGTALFDHMQQCFAANVSGPAVLTEALLPMLKNSHMTPRVVNVSSGAGSIALTLDPNVKGGPLTFPYKTSKAAMNMLGAVMVAKYGLSGEKIKVFTYCPGFCVSNLGPYNKLENGAKPTEKGSAPIVDIINGSRDSEQGQCLNSEGGKHPW